MEHTFIMNTEARVFAAAQQSKHNVEHTGTIEDCKDWKCEAALNVITDPRY